MKRPLSPDLSIYKLDMSAIMSISHRISGVILFLGTAGLLKMLIILAFFPSLWTLSAWFLKLWLFQGIMVFYAVALFYHCFNGLRHMIWDLGFGFDKKHVKASGIAVLSATLFSTILFWRAIYA